jgi:hypothetical protein
VTKIGEQFWWANDPKVWPCFVCGCPLQDGPNKDGFMKHHEVVHPERKAGTDDRVG